MRLACAARALTALALCAAALLQVGCSGVGSGFSNTPGGPQFLLISTTSLQNVLLGQPMSQTLQASGGTPPYAWTVTTALPPGLSLSSSGVISGTPTAVAQYSLGIKVTDSNSPPISGSASLRLFVAFPVSVTASIVPNTGNVGQQYSGLLRAGGGFGLSPYAWQLQSGSLPPGLLLTSAYSEGFISGTPTSPGAYTFTVQVTDPGPPQEIGSQSFTIVIDNNVLITTTSVPTAVLSRPYSTTLQAVAGTPPYSWSLQGFSLPPGLQLISSTGTISGTPTQLGDFTVVVVVADSTMPQPTTNGVVLYITINQQLSFSSSSLPDGVLNRPYVAPLPFQGGAPPYSFQIVSGSLPQGISLPASSSQSILFPTFQGTPSQLGTAGFTLRVTDSENSPVTIQGNFSIRVNPLLVGPSLGTIPNAAVGLSYSFSGFQASGGLPPLSWAFQSNASPPGLSIDPTTGVVSGTPTAPFGRSLCVQVSDSSVPPQTASDCPAFLVYAKLQVTTSRLPAIAAGAPMSLQLAASGGAGVYSWTAISLNLPSGLTFNPVNATISGQTAQTGTFGLTVQVSDAGPPAQTSGTVTLQFTVSATLGRNDSPATATPLSNGTYQASISPFSDPPTGVANPDSDYYVLTANPGATVTIEIKAQRLNPPSPLDSVLEIVDASNNPLSLCSAPANLCLNDDLPSGGSTDSILTMQVPASNSGPLTFYAHVLDWRGDARPDFIYTITVTGAN